MMSVRVLWRAAMAAPFAACLLTAAASAAGSIDSDLAAIKAIGTEGEGAPAAAAALKSITTSDASALPAILRAFEGANPLAVNYLRSAFETISDRTVRSGGALPTKELAAFVKDRRGNPRARSLAFEWLRKADEASAAELVPAMIDDPSSDLRRVAVNRLLDLAKAATEQDDAVKYYEEALAGAVEDDQVKDLVEKLKRAGKTVNLQQHFGFLPKWSIIGPFDNRERKGFAAEYPPEKTLDLDATYEGQLGEVSWTEVSTSDDYGVLDIAKEIKPYKGAVMYLATEFASDKARKAELRLGTPNAWKLWLNGKPLFSREEYHRGMALDQYRVPAELKAGRNVILVKLCQNEQTEDWAQRYQLQLRVCDSSGSALRSAVTATSRK